jgi:hypothetical protein
MAGADGNRASERDDICWRARATLMAAGIEVNRSRVGSKGELAGDRRPGAHMRGFCSH